MRNILILALILLASMVSACYATPTLQPTPAGLSWTTPTTNTDGSTLTDLTGYKIYWCGPVAPATTCAVFADAKSKDVGKVDSATIASLGLAKGAPYCYAATAYNTNNYESDYSNVVCKTDPLPLVIANPPVEQ